MMPVYTAFLHKIGVIAVIGLYISWGVLMIFVPLSPLIFKKNTLKYSFPTSISIKEDGCLESTVAKGSRGGFKSKSIKAIIKQNDDYIIKFKFPKLIILIIEKDLIVSGTIDDFEKIYKDKIVI